MSHDQNTDKKKRKSADAKHLEDTGGYLHEFTKGTENGKCIWRGLHKHKIHSCSYRYQAVQRAGEDDAVYNWPAYKDASARGEKIKTRLKTNDAGEPAGNVWYLKYYKLELDAPKESEWDLKGKNFRGPLKPYWNNAHHLLPVGMFKESLIKVSSEMAKTRRDENKQLLTVDGDICKILEMSLLEKSYNINHKLNMLILPMDDSVSDILRLPKHGGADSNFHGQYDALAKSHLDKVMDFYRTYLNDLPDKEHLTDKQKQAQKKRLELLSQRLYKLMTSECLRGKPSGAPYQGGRNLENQAPKWMKELE
ncbi:MAG: hypothetical protein EOO71_18580 [Myxococcaceae bacterium]|nr:MAG: hypothetical protein EOO71_18580 [Myxococcaceae bacterium]